MVVKNLTSNGFLSYHNEIFSYVTVIMFGEKTGVVIDKGVLSTWSNQIDY